MTVDSRATARIRVVAALIERDRRWLIARRAGSDSFAGKWEFPGGKVREGETDADALRREIREELGVEIRVGERICETDHDYADLSVHLCFYACELTSGEVGRSNDHDRLLWAERGVLERYEFLEGDLPLVRRLSLRG